MSKQKLVVASIALTACLCWAFRSTIAETPNQTTPSSNAASVIPENDQQVSIYDIPEAYPPSRIASNVDAVDPASRSYLVEQVDMSRVKDVPANGFDRAAAENEVRALLPCSNLAYRNLPTSQISVFLFGGPPLADTAVDDCTLPPGSSNRFVCAAQVTTLGFNQGGPGSYNLLVQVWSDCPEDPGATLLAQGSFLSLPNDGLQRVQTVTVDPPNLDVDDTFWVLCQSDNPDAAWEIARATSGINDIGSTLDIFAVLNGQPGCDFFFFGGNPVAGFTCTLLGSSGPAGSCCDLTSGICTDGIQQGSCNNFLTQSWSPLSCANAPPCIACTTACAFPGPNPPNREQEPDCFTNYTDTTNRGCQNLTTRAIGTFWTPLNCTTATSGCGRSGTYTFLNVFVQGGANQQVTENRRDDDHYMLALTQDTRVTWTVRGKFPSQALISFTLRQTNGTSTGVNCPTVIPTEPGDVSFTQAAACNETVATACLPGRSGVEGPFRYFLRARPSLTKLGDSALCGLPYEYSLTCEPCVRAPTAAELGACCTETACVYTSRLACLILTGNDTIFYQGEGTTCPNAACTGIPANDTCPNKQTLTCSSCVVTYNTTFAGSEGQSFGGGAGAVFKDVWYKYNVQQPGACANGRVIVSNIGTCFNSKIQMLRVSNCNASQATQCAGISLIGGVNLNPIQLEAGPPIVNVGPFVFGRSSQTLIPGAANGCVKLRVGGLTEDDFGAGTLRIDFVCAATSNAAQASWDANSGRCCFPDGSCLILPNTGDPAPPGFDGSAGTLPFDCCGIAGGYIRNRTDFYEGRTPPQTVAAGEVDGVGCATLPCPAQGEACFNAWDLNALYGGGEGTVTRQTNNRTYYKYVVPVSAPVGSGIVINTCGSEREPQTPGVFPLDTAFAVYRGQFNSATGECDGSQSAGVAPCIAAYNNTEVARVEDCNQTDARSGGAFGLASCYGPGETDACLCLQVISALGTPIAGQVRQGDTIYIGVGTQKGTSNGDSPRPFFDPLRAEGCDNEREIRIQVTNPSSCFICNLSCPGGSTPNPEVLPGAPCTDYVDTTNGGCAASLVANQNFTTITCGQTFCGSSATYRLNKACTATADCDLGDTCISLVCVGPNDNEQDFDYYRIEITQPTRLTWTVNATFPATLQIISSPTNSCSDQTVVANTVNISQCSATTAAADLCVGWAYLVVVPTNELGVPCGSLYYATLSCSSPSVAAAGCCKGDMNNDGTINGKDIKPWINQVLPIANGGQPAIAFNPVGGCFDVLTCRGDANNDYKVDLSDLSGFVSLLLAGGNCPATSCGDAAACHLPSLDDSGVVSDLSVSTFGGGFRVADDFKIVTGTSITSICWYGFYFNYNSTIGCTPSGGDSADSWKVTFYNDASGLPGTVIGSPQTLGVVGKVDTGVDITYLARANRRYQYTATLPNAVAVTPGTCYWIEIVNTTTGGCLWHWETSATMGNGLSVQKTGGGPAGASNWYAFDFATDDFAFCLPGLRIDNLDCGLPLGKCCVYPPMQALGTCSIQNQPVCEVILGGLWQSGLDCSASCPPFPLNDMCANAYLVTSGPIYSGSTLFPATIDGPAWSCEQNCGGGCNSANDVWYKWVATFNGNATFTMCDAWTPGANIDGVPVNNDDFRYDAMMAVYDNCPGSGGAQIPGGCNDDFCSAQASTVSQITATTITAGRTYWIRIGGWQGTNGVFTFRVNQP